MALANYSDLTTSIASWTARSDYSATNYSDFTALFEAWANRTLRVRQMETTATVTMSGGAGALPSDYLQWRRVTWPGSSPVELQYVHPSVLRGYYPSVASFTPGVFSIEGSNIQTQSSDTTSLTLEYWQKITSLASGSTNWLMTAHPDLYLYGTLVEAYLFNKDPDNALIWKGRRDDLLGEISRLDKSSIGPAAVRVFGHTP